MMRFLNLLPFLVLAFSACASANQQPLCLSSSTSPFDPRSYGKRVAHCSAVNREGSQLKLTNIDLHYVDINPSADRTLLLVHGWPALWSTWSKQIQHFEKDYHLIVPDLRGFGASTHPGDVQSSGTMADMVSDLACILQDTKVQHKVVCVGHDWGAQVCYEAARMRPDLIEAVVGVVTPYISAAGPFASTEQLSALHPTLNYMQFFEKHTHEAAEELNASIRRTLRATLRSAVSPPPMNFLRSTTSFLEGWKEVEEIPPIPFLTQAEEDYLVEQYSIQGFDNTLQFYTYGNRLGTWLFDRSQGNFTIHQPALYIFPTNDPVGDWEAASAMLHSAAFFKQLSTEKIDAQHWPQLEQPEEFNHILRAWLTNHPIR